MRALVSMPRSPTNTIRSSLNRSRNLRTCEATGLGIAGVALKHFDRHRTTVGVGLYAEDDLQVAGSFIA